MEKGLKKRGERDGCLGNSSQRFRFSSMSHTHMQTRYTRTDTYTFSLFRLYLLCSVEFFRHTVYLPGFLQRVGCFSDVVAMLGSTGYTFNSVVLLNFLI